MVRLNAGRPLRIAFFAAIALYIAIPMVAVILYSLSTRWTSHILPDGYTLAHWRDALGEDRLRQAVFRTSWMALAVLALDVAVVVPAVYWQRVRNPRIRTLTELSAAIPFVLPFVVIAFGILKLMGMNETTARLLGTPWIIWLGHAAIAFPFLYWAVDGAMSAANVVGLNEAAQICGAMPLQTLRYVVLPNIGAGLAAGGMLVFATSFGEFAVVQILTGARFENVSLYSLDLLAQTTSHAEKLAVLTIITFVVLFSVSVGVVYANRGQIGRLLPGARAMSGERQT
jgi:putative spermidine/putrescine transport system permease protein